jgi:hypothetical protein
MHQLHFDPTAHLPSPEVVHQLESSVKRHLNGRLRDFSLVVNDDGVILHGRTTSYYAKQLAQEAVREAIKLPILANFISVGGNSYVVEAGGLADSVELTDETFLEEEEC